LALDELIDGLAGAPCALGDFGGPDQFVGVDVEYLEAVDGFDGGDGREDGVEQGGRVPVEHGEGEGTLGREGGVVASGIEEGWTQRTGRANRSG
jgi:hypothetical protein